MHRRADVRQDRPRERLRFRDIRINPGIFGAHRYPSCAFIIGEAPICCFSILAVSCPRARFNPTGFQPVSFQQVRVETTIVTMKELPLAGGAAATFSRAQSLPPLRR
jgi:hypothetical protein